MKSHWKTIPTLQHDKKEVGTRNHGNFHWMQKVFKDQWIIAVIWKRRSKHAEYCITTIQRSLEVEINLSLQSNQSDKSLINNLKALRKTIIDLKLLLHNGDTILLPQRIHLRNHDDNQAATCGQLGARIRGNHHPGLNSELCFLLWLFQWCHFACQKFFSPGNRRRGVNRHVHFLLNLRHCLPHRP